MSGASVQSGAIAWYPAMGGWPPGAREARLSLTNAEVSMNDAANIFSGLKVVDLASYIAGLAAATILSDLGADVIKVGSAYAMPLTSPAYPKPPFRFVNREFVIITYRTDPRALARAIPAPLKAADPIVKYEFINMPDSSGLGSYTESGQVVLITFQGQPGGFTHAMYLDSEAGIASGRELLGFPKVLAQPKLEVRNDALVGTLDYNGVRVATATMAYKHRVVDLETVKKSVEAPGILAENSAACGCLTSYLRTGEISGLRGAHEGSVDRPCLLGTAPALLRSRVAIARARSDLGAPYSVRSIHRRR